MKIRTFIAIPVPEKTRLKIGKCLEELSLFKGVKWVRAENLHITLRFLGNVAEELMTEIGQRIRQALPVGSLSDLEAKGVGLFPGPERPRIFWVGLKGDISPLQDLQNAINKNLQGLDIKPAEEKPFIPHLTIGRVQFLKNPKPLLEVFRHFEATRFGSVPMDNVVLVKSELTREGARYTQIQSFPLISGEEKES